MFLFTETSIPALSPTHPLIQWVKRGGGGRKPNHVKVMVIYVFLPEILRSVSRLVCILYYFVLNNQHCRLFIALKQNLGRHKHIGDREVKTPVTR
jgi:hypothetical protein